MDPSPPDININNTEDQRQRDVNRSRGHRAEHRAEMIEVAPPRAATPAPQTCLTRQESNQHVQHQQHLLQTSLPDPYFHQRLHPLWFQPHSHLLMMTPRSPQDVYFMNMCPVLVSSLWPPLLPLLPPVYSYQLNAPEHHQLHCPNLNEQQQSLETSKGNYQETTTTASVTTSSGINRNTEDDDGDERKLEAGDNAFLEIMNELWSNEASDADIQSILDVEYLDHLLSSLPQPADFMSVETLQLDVDAANEPVTDTDSSPLGLAASTDLDSSVSSDPQTLDSVALEEQEQTLQPHRPSAGSSSDSLLRRDTDLRPDGQNTLNTDVTPEHFNNCHTGSRFSDFTNFLNVDFDGTDEEELSALRPADNTDLTVSEDASTLLSDFLNKSSSTLSTGIQSGCLLGNTTSESDGASTSCPAGSNKDSSVPCGDLVEKVHLLTLKTETKEDNSIFLNTNSAQLSHEIQNSPLLKDPSASESDQTFCLTELIEDLSVLCNDLVEEIHPPTLKMETKEDILRFLLDFPDTDSTQLSHKIQIGPLLGDPSTSESNQASTSCLAGSNRDTLVPCGDLVPPTLKTETKEDVSIFLNTNSAQLFHETENSLLLKDPSTSESDQTSCLAESNMGLSVPCKDPPTLKTETEEDASMFLSDSDSTRLSHKIQNSPLLQDPTTSEPDHASASCFSGSIQDPSLPDRDLVGKVCPPALKTKTKEDILMRLSYFIKTFSTHKTRNRPPPGDQTTSESDRAATSCLSESNKDPSVPPPALITETEEDASTFLSNSNTDSTQLSHKVQTGSGLLPDPTSSESDQVTTSCFSGSFEDPLVSHGVLVGKIRPETEEHHLIKDPSNTSGCPDSRYPKVVRNSDSEPEKHVIETMQSLETPEGSASPIISSELRTKDRCDIEKNSEENLDKVGRTSVTQEEPATKARDQRVKEITFQSRENKENDTETKRRRSQRLSSEFKTERAEVKDGVVHETRRSGKRQLCKRAESNCGEQSQGTERSSETQSEVEEEEKCEAKTSQEEEEDAQRSRSGRVTRSKVRQSEEKKNEASTFPSVKTLRSSSLDQNLSNQTSRSSGLKPSPDQTTDETKRERKRKNEDKSNVPQSRKKKHRSERDVSEETNVFTRNTRSKTKAAAAAAAVISTRTRNSQRRLDKKKHQELK